MSIGTATGANAASLASVNVRIKIVSTDAQAHSVKCVVANLYASTLADAAGVKNVAAVPSASTGAVAPCVKSVAGLRSASTG